MGKTGQQILPALARAARSQPPQRGMTLIELAIVLALTGILAAFLAPMTYEAVSAYEASVRGYDALYKVRFALDRIANEVREIRRDPSDLGSYDVDLLAFSASSLGFDRSDGTAVAIAYSSPVVTVRYGSNAAATLLDGATSFQLSYLQSDGTTPATSRSDLAYVNVELTVTESGVTYSGRRRIDLRTGE